MNDLVLVNDDPSVSDNFKFENSGDEDYEINQSSTSSKNKFTGRKNPLNGFQI